MLMLPIVLAAVGLASAAEFSNPIRDSGPDPFIVWDKDTSSYYLMTTTGSDLRLVSSPTIGGLHDGTNTQVYTNADMKNQATVWAGELHKVNGAWHIYYSHKERIWAIKGGDNPLDEYADPVQLYDHFGIDNTVLAHNDNNYLLWACHSTDVSNNTIAGSSMCISHLTTPTSINKDEISVISRPTEAWEQVGGHVNEGAQPLYWDGEIYVTYSASFCTKPDYSLGLLHLIGDDPMDPAAWSKVTDGPVFSSGNGEYGPGHNGIFTSPDGTELWNVYHAVTNANGSCGMDRQTFVEKVDVSQFTSKGPIFGTPAKKGVVAEGPSGEGNNTGQSSSSALSATSAATRSSSASSNAASSSDATPTISLTTSSIVASTALSLTASLSTTESSGESPTASSSASSEEEDEASTSSHSRGGHHTTQSGDGGIALIASGSESASSLDSSSRTTVTVGQGEVTRTTTLFVTAKTSQALAAEVTSTLGTGGLSCKAKRARVAEAASLLVV